MRGACLDETYFVDSYCKIGILHCLAFYMVLLLGLQKLILFCFSWSENFNVYIIFFFWRVSYHASNHSFSLKSYLQFGFQTFSVSSHQLFSSIF